MNDIILSSIVALGSAVVTYLMTKRREKAEAKVTTAQAHISELDATEKAVAIWRTLAQDLNNQVNELRILVVQLRTENDRLKDEIELLKEQIKINKTFVSSHQEKQNVINESFAKDHKELVNKKKKESE